MDNTGWGIGFFPAAFSLVDQAKLGSHQQKKEKIPMAVLKSYAEVSYAHGPNLCPPKGVKILA